MDKNVNRNGIAGVSLVEIMISLVLVAFALIAITTVFPRIMGHRKGIAEAEQANIIAMEALEFMQNGGYTCNEIKNDGDDFYTTYADTLEIGAAKYVVGRTNVKCPTSADSISTVEVFVTWKKSGKTHLVKMTGALR